MTVTAVQITRRPEPTRATRLPAGRAAEPADVLIVADIEALTRTNLPGCGDDNPYR